MAPNARDRGQQWLAKGGLRPTRQRLSLASLLVGDGEDRHVTAELLHTSALDAGERVSLATVYNTLRAFCDAGLMHEVTVDGTRSYFDTRMDDHPHFFWEDEARISDAPKEDMQITKLPTPPEGYEIASVDVVVRLRKL
ncbi:iron response transcriptional regulator IrrA [Thioclava sp. GXIMD4216]|uniref:Ferric uptake regulation protein n=1 Tax=Thioclava litoralis TaxID=3076557 RepID=A0ABZ1DZP0_9RHOB|nr:transcriptional repressor [Thioclava sp. FTW29]